MAGKAFLRSAWHRLSTIWRYSGVLLLFLGGRPLSKMWKRAHKEQQNTCRNFFPSTKPTCVQEFKAATTSNQQQTRTTYPKVLHKHCGGFTNCNTKYLLEVVALRRLQLIFPTCGQILFLLHRNSKEFTILRVQFFFFLWNEIGLFSCFHVAVQVFSSEGGMVHQVGMTHMKVDAGKTFETSSLAQWNWEMNTEQMCKVVSYASFLCSFSHAPLEINFGTEDCCVLTCFLAVITIFLLCVLTDWQEAACAA